MVICQVGTAQFTKGSIADHPTLLPWRLPEIQKVDHRCPGLSSSLMVLTACHISWGVAKASLARRHHRGWLVGGHLTKRAELQRAISAVLTMARLVEQRLSRAKSLAHAGSRSETFLLPLVAGV